MLGANLYLLAGGLAALAQQWWFLSLYGGLQESGIFLSMLVVGLVVTFTTSAGFVAVRGAPPAQVRRHSLWLLAATLLAVGASFLFRGDRTWAAWVPVLGLAVVQRWLRSRLEAQRHGMPDVEPEPAKVSSVGRQASASTAGTVRRVVHLVIAVIVLVMADPDRADLQTADLAAGDRQALDTDKVDEAIAIFEEKELGSL